MPIDVLSHPAATPPPPIVITTALVERVTVLASDAPMMPNKNSK